MSRSETTVDEGRYYASFNEFSEIASAGSEIKSLLEMADDRSVTPAALYLQWLDYKGKKDTHANRDLFISALLYMQRHKDIDTYNFGIQLPKKGNTYWSDDESSADSN